MGGAYKKATDARAAQARQCVDPFHLVKLANEAVDKTRRWSWNVHRDFGIGLVAVGQTDPLGAAQRPRPT